MKNTLGILILAILFLIGTASAYCEYCTPSEGTTAIIQTSGKWTNITIESQTNQICVESSDGFLDCGPQNIFEPFIPFIPTCDYPLEVVALFTLIPLIAIVISITILWYYATRSAESLTNKIINIAGAIIIDVIILSLSISLFYALSGCGP